MAGEKSVLSGEAGQKLPKNYLNFADGKYPNTLILDAKAEENINHKKQREKEDSTVLMEFKVIKAHSITLLKSSLYFS